MAAPLGNKNGMRYGMFHGALIRAIRQRDALAQDDGRTLRTIADKVLDLAADGDKDALVMVRDSLDGKPRQQVDVNQTVLVDLRGALADAYGRIARPWRDLPDTEDAQLVDLSTDLLPDATDCESAARELALDLGLQAAGAQGEEGDP